jgi:glycerol uptake operon antiterminator
VTGNRDLSASSQDGRGPVLESIRSHPIIAAVRDLRTLPHALSTPVQVIFLMTGDIFTIGDAVASIRAADKTAILHIDLLKGLATDREGMLFVAQNVKPDGVVSTKQQLLHAARRVGLLTVQHLFLIDTQAFETGIQHVHQFGPDVVEVMPGLMPRVVRDLTRRIDVPLVAAGLIRSFAEVREVLEAGAVAAVVGYQELWNLTLS